MRKILCYGPANHAACEIRPPTGGPRFRGCRNKAARLRSLPSLADRTSESRRCSTRFSARRSPLWMMSQGVTRDRNYADATYRNRKFRLVDTGGLDLSASASMLTLIRRQVGTGDCRGRHPQSRSWTGVSGLTPPDHEVVRLLRGVTKPLFLCHQQNRYTKIRTPTRRLLPIGNRPTLSRIRRTWPWGGRALGCHLPAASLP